MISLRKRERGGKMPEVTIKRVWNAKEAALNSATLLAERISNWTLDLRSALLCSAQPAESKLNYQRISGLLAFSMKSTTLIHLRTKLLISLVMQNSVCCFKLPWVISLHLNLYVNAMLFKAAHLQFFFTCHWLHELRGHSQRATKHRKPLCSYWGIKSPEPERASNPCQIALSSDWQKCEVSPCWRRVWSTHVSEPLFF